MASIPASFPDIIKKRICVIGVPLDLGQQRRGVDMGPSAVRVAGLQVKLEALGHEVEDAGNISVTLPEQKNFGDPQARYLREITATCTKLAEEVLHALEAGKTPLRNAASLTTRSTTTSTTRASRVTTKSRN